MSSNDRVWFAGSHKLVDAPKDSVHVLLEAGLEVIAHRAAERSVRLVLLSSLILSTLDQHFEEIRPHLDGCSKAL